MDSLPAFCKDIRMDGMSILGKLNTGWRRKLPLILQTEASECGLASICMIANHFGHQADLASLRRRFGMSLKGATMRELIRIADHIGFATRPLRLELDELTQLRTPCILHWDLNHFVVLESADAKNVTIYDPAMGVRAMSVDAAGRHFTGIALELIPTNKFETAAAAPRVRGAQLIGHISGLKRSLAYLFGMAGAIEVFAIISPLFLGLVIDHALVSADRDLLVTLAAGFVLLLFLRTAIETMRRWMLMGLNASLKVQSRANLLSHLQNLPVTYFESRHLGDIMSRFGSQEVILQAVTSELVEAVLDGVMAIVTLIIMLMLAPGLTGIVLAGGLIYAGLRWVTYTPLRQATGEAIVWGGRRDSHFLETMRGIRTIKLFNAQGERRAQWLNLLVETVNRQLTADKLRLVFSTANRLLFGLMAILIIWLGASKVLDGAMSTGLLIAFIAYKDQFLGRLTELINKVVDLTMLRLHAERLADIALTEGESQSQVKEFGPNPSSLKIELRHVSFRYGEQEPWILDDVSFKILAHESVAIVGASGGGKTTLLKLLAGLLKPTEGEIFINDVPLSQIGLARYRSMLGVVMQDDNLFAGSIADNICFFSERPNQDLIEDCAVLAAVHDDVASMPMGYSTLIGDMGTVLSGGQKQRILIARALYRWPALLLLDEATSHLDVEREKAVNASLKLTDMTRIIIAHRPETIRASDRVIELANGKVANQRSSLTGLSQGLGRLHCEIARAR
jgi:ATP-binding cassette, subfamily B, bacterial CvaB/MchF/RaxB